MSNFKDNMRSIFGIKKKAETKQNNAADANNKVIIESIDQIEITKTNTLKELQLTKPIPTTPIKVTDSAPNGFKNPMKTLTPSESFSKSILLMKDNQNKNVLNNSSNKTEESNSILNSENLPFQLSDNLKTNKYEYYSAHPIYDYLSFTDSTLVKPCKWILEIPKIFKTFVMIYFKVSETEKYILDFANEMLELIDYFQILGVEESESNSDKKSIDFRSGGRRSYINAFQR
ncbi:hypothetical protein KGF54_004961 [Candida jiufengensis]|uniref:uncharacterized protein n=1 Tax=Candida jiufengensis TaxID=497108 RepID=UPI0022240C97|nr:uncharacterized protein KGF54_004961 [Candida jiufengensis]KAI5951886.1 hypothetical protein KGF54_004961 [Candida jiufengensis]